MKILYVAKHNSGDNDDEGAIAHALRELGHEVICVNENWYHYEGQPAPSSVQADFCLFHKWPTLNFAEFKQMKIPRVFWYFDLVKAPQTDPTLRMKTKARVEWMQLFAPRCAVGFCTDGDWAEYWNEYHKTPDKLLKLSQGMDERYIKPLESQLNVTSWENELLFTGTPHHGVQREIWCKKMQQTYGSDFKIKGSSYTRFHHEALRDLLLTTRITLAPDGPNTNKYWSNRVYHLTGYGAFLLHPYCSELERDYPPGTLEMYRDFDELKNMIKYYRDNPIQREEMRIKTHQQTVKHNLYRHRLVKLLDIVRERI